MAARRVGPALEPSLITLDTSAILTLADRRDREHTTVRAALTDDPGPQLVPAAILSEIAYLLETRMRPEVLDGFLEDLALGRLTLDCGEEDLPRIRELIRRYADLSLGFADAAVVACAERNGGRVLALDRDFEIVAREGTITLLP